MRRFARLKISNEEVGSIFAVGTFPIYLNVAQDRNAIKINIFIYFIVSIGIIIIA